RAAEPSSGGAGSPGAAGMPADDAGAPDTNVSVHPTRAISNPPTYLGGSGCMNPYRTTGFAPSDTNEPNPLFLYFVGTRFVDSDTSARFDSQAAAKVTEAMARRGFVALSVEYDNGIADVLNNKLDCLYGKNSTETLLGKACAMSGVDCSRGIATWGHSQGALLAHMAATFDARVKAVWTTGYGGIDNPTLPSSRLRVVNGEADAMNAAVATLNKTTGLSSGECPADGRDHCLRADGSGWVIVRKTACVTSMADHCWFDRRSCADSSITLEPNWIDAKSNTLFALEGNADWVAETVRRP
ncbi:MAG TPA: hypothetical protein VJV78_14540, partial [Polyangiales bacterium]|nr:hypothetical protein [Polyangiales bacterium]